MKREPLTAEDFGIVLATIGRGAGPVVKSMTIDDKREAELFRDLRIVSDYIQSVGGHRKGTHNAFAFWDQSIV